MTHVLYIVSRLRSSGPTNQLYYLLKYLGDEFKPTILTLSPEPEDTELDKFLQLNIDFETLGLSRLKGVIQGPTMIRSIVNELNPCIVHSQGIRSDTLTALLLSDYHRISTIRNYPYDDYPAKFGRIFGNVMAYEHLQMLKRLDHPVACSKTISKMVEPHGINSLSIQNGVDRQRFSPIKGNKKLDMRQQHNIPENDTIIISVGSLIPRKDPMTIIKGFQQSKLKNSKLIILGDGPLMAACKKFALNNDDILFLGNVDNVEKYLQMSDYFVSASISEGLPNSVLEALSVGLPVCLSKIGPHNEILQYNPKVGTKFEVGSPSAMSKALVNLIQNKKIPSTSAQNLIRKHLSAQKMSENYQNLYRSITS